MPSYVRCFSTRSIDFLPEIPANRIPPRLDFKSRESEIFSKNNGEHLKAPFYVAATRGWKLFPFLKLPHARGFRSDSRAGPSGSRIKISRQQVAPKRRRNGEKRDRDDVCGPLACHSVDTVISGAQEGFSPVITHNHLVQPSTGNTRRDFIFPDDFPFPFSGTLRYNGLYSSTFYRARSRNVESRRFLNRLTSEKIHLEPGDGVLKKQIFSRDKTVYRGSDFRRN